MNLCVIVHQSQNKRHRFSLQHNMAFCHIYRDIGIVILVSDEWISVIGFLSPYSNMFHVSLHTFSFRSRTQLCLSPVLPRICSGCYVKCDHRVYTSPGGRCASKWKQSKLYEIYTTTFCSQELS